ncbi:MAG: FAD-binding oxidoreductase, partial [Bacteroidota bacterium]
MELATTFLKNAPKNLEIITRENPLYQYARVISNTRFGKMPFCIAYCAEVAHVQYCINYCRDYKFPFRIRSGGHQHEGMCSANNVIIIDLSKINQIEPIWEDEEKTAFLEAWIPAGKQLGQVYDELDDYGKTIPGGGCQSVNVGGLTQGGGWGTSVRKFGLTCDSVLAIEMVLANGEFVTVTKKSHPELFWAVRGSGGGNFGVVIRFKFKLASILPVTTNFSVSWEDPEKIKGVITQWATLHATQGGIDTNLSATCTMIKVRVKNSEVTQKNNTDEYTYEVHGRMAGKFYGSKNALKDLLLNYFGKWLKGKIDDDTFTEIPENYSDTTSKSNQNESTANYAASQRTLIDKINPRIAAGYLKDQHDSCKKLDLTVLPNSGPSSTCDQPHPHKISSSFPKDDVNHEVLVTAIYEYLYKSCYYADANMYMSFHCMGGKVTENAGTNAFGY